MNLISRDIEKERLLDDCIKCRCYNVRDNLEEVLDICIEEDMTLDEIESTLKDNCITIGEYRSIMYDIFLKVDYNSGKTLADRLHEDLMNLPVTLIR